MSRRGFSEWITHARVRKQGYPRFVLRRGKKRKLLFGDTVYLLSLFPVTVYRYAKNDESHYPTKTRPNFRPNKIPAPIILKKPLLKILAGDFETSRTERRRGRRRAREGRREKEKERKRAHTVRV